MSEIFFAYSNVDDIREAYFDIEDYVLYENEDIIIGGDRKNFAQNDDFVIVTVGNIFNIHEFGCDVENKKDADIILELLKNEEIDVYCRDFSGCFCIFIYDKENKLWKIITDIFGNYCPYYFLDDDEFIVSMNFYDFHKSFFDIDTMNFAETIKYNGDPYKTVLAGVKKMQEGSILYWPACEQEIYIDLYEELEEGYTNKIDITFEEAVDKIENILVKTIYNSIRLYGPETVNSGVLVNNNIGSLILIALLNYYKITPYLYSFRYPIQEKLPEITARKAKTIDSNCKKTFDKNLEVLNLKEQYDFVYDYEKIDSYFSSELSFPTFSPPAMQALFLNNEINEQMQKDDISLLFTQDASDEIFLHKMEYYIINKLSKNKEIEIHELKMDEIKEIAGEVMAKPSFYSSGLIEDNSFTKHGHIDDFIDFILKSSADIEKKSTESSNFIFNEIKRISIYKNHKLWKFILSLPDSVLEENMLDASLLKALFKKHTNKKVNNIRRYPSWNTFHPQIVLDKKSKEYIKILNRIPFTEIAESELLDAISFFYKCNVYKNFLWSIDDNQILDEASSKVLKVIMLYKWLKHWRG